MEDKLCEAAIEGDVDSLIEITNKDKFVLHKIVAGRGNGSPLHVAASHGHAAFVKQLLLLNGKLIEVLDSQRRSALHMASARGHVDVVKELIGFSPETCLVRDQDGRNPVHIASMKGQIDVLQILFRGKPHAVKNKINGGDTIVLHLCVKYDQMDTFKLLLKLNNISEFVNAKDGSGNTVLHLAVSDKHFEMVKYMLNRENYIKIDVNATNSMEQTPLDIALRAQEGKEDKDAEIKKIENHLRRAGAKKGKDIAQSEWLSNKRNSIMVVASLIATMAFQAGVSPPGGVWSENGIGHRAGETVMAYNYPDAYPWFLRVNTVGLVTSLSTILLLISGLPFRKRVYMWGLVVTMWLSITAMAFTYSFSITVVTPKKDREALSDVISCGVMVWASLMAILLVVHTVNLMVAIAEDKRNKMKAIRNILESSTGKLCSQGFETTNSFTRIHSHD